MVSGKCCAALHANPMDLHVHSTSGYVSRKGWDIKLLLALRRSYVAQTAGKKLGTTDLDHGRIFFRDSCQCFHHSTRKKLGCQMNWGWNLFLNISPGSVAHKCNSWSSESFEVYRKTTLDFDEVWISSFSHHLLLPPSLYSHHKIKTEAHVYFCIAV